MRTRECASARRASAVRLARSTARSEKKPALTCCPTQLRGPLQRSQAVSCDHFIWPSATVRRRPSHRPSVAVFFSTHCECPVRRSPAPVSRSAAAACGRAGRGGQGGKSGLAHSQ
eukprot:12003595-Alexandrium_andersonii.AAC.1